MTLSRKMNPVNGREACNEQKKPDPENLIKGRLPNTSVIKWIEENLLKDDSKENARKPYVLNDIPRIIQEYKEALGVNHSGVSIMPEKFHPPIFPDWLYPRRGSNDPSTSENTRLYRSLVNMGDRYNCKFPVLEGDNLFYYYHLLKVWERQMMDKLGISGISGYVKTSGREKKQSGSIGRNRYSIGNQKKPRETCRGIFNFKKNRYHPREIPDIKAFSMFVGRLNNSYETSIGSINLPIGKSGLVHPLMDTFLTKYKSGSNDELPPYEWLCANFPGAFFLLAITISEFSQRKQFTLDTQTPGRLNHLISQLLKLVKDNEKHMLPLVALVLPDIEIYKCLLPSDLDDIYDMTKMLLTQAAFYLEEKWHSGYKLCVMNDCMVPRRGSKLNSSKVNSTVDAYNSLRRFLRAVEASKELHDPIYTKLRKAMLLVAGDQHTMAQFSGKTTNPNVKISAEFAKIGTPWQYLVDPECQQWEMNLAVRLPTKKSRNVPTFDILIGPSSAKVKTIDIPEDLLVDGVYNISDNRVNNDFKDAPDCFRVTVDGTKLKCERTDRKDFDSKELNKLRAFIVENFPSESESLIKNWVDPNIFEETKIRKDDKIVKHKTLVCGVEVLPETYNSLKGSGAYGSNKYNP